MGRPVSTYPRPCKDCGLSLPINAFPKAGSKGTGRRARCQTCHNAHDRALRLQKAADAGVPFKPRVNFDPATGTKWCPTCEAHKPLDAFALSPSRGKDGRQGECRSCRSARYARYREANADKEAERHRRYKRENRAVVLAKARADRKRAYYRDPDTARQARRDYWHAMTTEERQEYYERNRDARYVHQGLRRARVIGTKAEPIRRATIIARDGRTCYLCGRESLTDRQIHLDHVVPLARGGTHTADNIRVACGRCNYRKSDRLLSELDLSQFAAVS